MTAWEALTPVQADAVHATAAAHLLDPEELVAELVHLLAERPSDPAAWAVHGDELSVNEPLTPDSDQTETLTVTFTTAPPSTWSPS